jgi:hypothetical protein
MDSTLLLRKELDQLLAKGSAHTGFDEAIADFPAQQRGVKPPGVPHSAWELLEHLRIAQWDMLEFSRDPAHQSPQWPAGYWPKTSTPPDDAAWEKSVKAFRHDLAAMRKLVTDPKSDLFTPFPHGDGQTLLREALQVADHNAWHVGELGFLRRLLGCWK